jgi:putative nucleotidyltransferase with HDIG domain
MSRTASELQQDAVKAFVHDLVHAALTRGLHAADSSYVHDAMVEMLRSLRQAAAAGVEMPLVLQIGEDRIYHHGVALNGPSLQAGSLLRACRERQIASLQFALGMDPGEANRCFDLLLLPQNREAFARHQRDQALHAFGIRSLRVSLAQPGDPCNRRASVNIESEALRRYQDLAQSLQQNHARAHRDQELAVDNVQSVIECTLSQLEEPSALLALANQDEVDRFTVGHSVRVALLALQVARAVGATREQLVQVGSAALMHDIGKSKVPQEILWKRGRLSPDEWQAMSQHPRLGAEILLEQHEYVDPATIGAAFCHHMGPGSCGYPQTALPVAPCAISRLIRVCDVFEALTSVRPYKRALVPIEAYAVMFRNEADFDAGWLRHFARTLGVFPTGTRVVLDDGSMALVVRQSEQPHLPIVRILGDAAGQPLANGQPDEVKITRAGIDGGRQILAIDGIDRALRVPEFEEAAEILTVDPSHACVSQRLAIDAQRAG